MNFNTCVSSIRGTAIYIIFVCFLFCFAQLLFVEVHEVLIYYLCIIVISIKRKAKNATLSEKSPEPISTSSELMDKTASKLY